MTLTDEDTNAIQTDNANRAIQGNVAMQIKQVAFYLAGEITQVIDSIPWVRCASGNVFRGVSIKLAGCPCYRDDNVDFEDIKCFDLSGMEKVEWIQQ